MSGPCETCGSYHTPLPPESSMNDCTCPSRGESPHSFDCPADPCACTELWAVTPARVCTHCRKRLPNRRHPW